MADHEFSIVNSSTSLLSFQLYFVAFSLIAKDYTMLNLAENSCSPIHTLIFVKLLQSSTKLLLSPLQQKLNKLVLIFCNNIIIS